MTSQPYNDDQTPMTQDSAAIPDRSALRRLMRQRRRALSTLEQKKAARQLKNRVLSMPEFMRAKRIAFYLPNDGEISPALLIEQARAMGKTCYLPVLQPLAKNRLWFVRYDHQTPMTQNRFGIAEPKLKGYADKVRNRCRPEDLDLVFLPLVAFDKRGGRMGMGGGFYDRTFAFTHIRRTTKPALTGLAHELQNVEYLPLAHWDIPLHAVITERNIYRSKRS